MQLLGAPMHIQNTDSGHWLVTCNDLVSSAVESVSFTIAVRRSDASLGQIQKAAVEGAIAHLEGFLKNLPAK